MTTTELAEQISRYTGFVDGLIFAVLALVGVIEYARKRTAGSLWFAALSLAITGVVIGSEIILRVYGQPETGPTGDALIATKALVSLLALFPFFLYRFMRSFAPAPRKVEVLAVLATIVLVTWTIALPEFPGPGSDRKASFLAYVTFFLVHWIVMSAIVSAFFWKASRQHSGVAKQRLRYLAIASTLMAMVIFISGFTTSEPNLALVLATSSFGFIASLSFYIAYQPPKLLRMAWRSKEVGAFQHALREFLAADSQDAVVSVLLPAAVDILGGRGAVAIDNRGRVIGASGIDQSEMVEVMAVAESSHLPSHMIRARYDQGSIIVLVSSVTPFFGRDELAVLNTVAAFSSLAMRKAELLEQETEANARLRRLDLLKNEFVAMVAHDMRSPMTVIAGFADTIDDGWDRISDEQKLEFIRLISRNTRSLATFVEDVLQVSRIESGELSYEMSAFDAREVAARTIRELMSLEEGVDVQLECPNDLPLAFGDEERNWQILTNLISNAIKFSAELPRVKVCIHPNDSGQMVVVRVNDNGPGIAEEDMPQLFQKFSRVGMTRSIKGTGLGLYIVKSMVEAQGGQIWVESKLGAGSTFSYSLPVAAKELAG